MYLWLNNLFSEHTGFLLNEIDNFPKKPFNIHYIKVKFKLVDDF
jgi:hypothetical protein